MDHEILLETVLTAVMDSTPEPLTLLSRLRRDAPDARLTALIRALLSADQVISETFNGSGPGRADAIVRIKHEYNHGSSFRYDLEVVPFVEGDLDLADYLERKDGTSMDDVPELWLRVEALLPEEVLRPKDQDVPQPGKVGGYRKLLIALGAAWLIGLVALIFAFRRKVEEDAVNGGLKPASLADRLRPLVEEARNSELSNERRAELERLLLAHWRGRRGLASVPVAQAVAELRADDEAGPLFRQLEEWLHRPARASSASVDVAALLAPYEDIAADAEGGQHP